LKLTWADTGTHPSADNSAVAAATLFKRPIMWKTPFVQLVPVKIEARLRRALSSCWRLRRRETQMFDDRLFTGMLFFVVFSTNRQTLSVLPDGTPFGLE
jgi:hypothetical protein